CASPILQSSSHPFRIKYPPHTLISIRTLRPCNHKKGVSPMNTRPLGNSGIDASTVAFGAWAIGGWTWGGTEEKESIRAIHAYLANGGNFIETAPVYGFGVSEEIVGKALSDRRDKAVLATKCSMRWDLTEAQKARAKKKFSTTEATIDWSGE